MERIHYFAIAFTAMLFIAYAVVPFMNMMKIPTNLYRPYVLLLSIVTLFIIILPQKKNIFI